MKSTLFLEKRPLTELILHGGSHGLRDTVSTIHLTFTGRGNKPSLTVILKIYFVSVLEVL